MPNATDVPSGGPRVLVGATGSVAVTALPSYLDALRARLGGTYTVLMTHTAASFIPPDTVRLGAERVVHGEAPADWPTDKPSRLVADHDILVVLPATANILSAAATGAAPNRIATVILSSTFPVVFFPHMGGPMWNKPAVQRNVAQLRADGHHVPEPEWHESVDLSGLTTRHPALPAPEKAAEIVAELLEKTRTA
ncbi:flavoprotein [Streptomyces caatingaensis]|uniref:Flavoprotein n=1 Tax=Streptomyces caatingaensis TaxID=1678637 RepID=A0A0K9XHQ6_9ACTN|nr:flavoprotein [Streptomyces caatingaensis]KNB52808.1 flavoprotein [Streptomyces caatingaensis]